MSFYDLFTYFNGSSTLRYWVPTWGTQGGLRYATRCLQPRVFSYFFISVSVTRGLRCSGPRGMTTCSYCQDFSVASKLCSANRLRSWQDLLTCDKGFVSHSPPTHPQHAICWCIADCLQSLKPSVS